MKKDGLIPIAFADKDGWPAMGTFDILNLRINGYDFHVNLMAGKESWNSAKVKKVFDTWAELLPSTSRRARPHLAGGRPDAAAEEGRHVPARARSSRSSSARADQDDLDFFAFPEIDRPSAQDAVDAPIDGYMMSQQAQEPGRRDKLLEYLARPRRSTSSSRTTRAPWSPTPAPTPVGYTALQKKAVELVDVGEEIAQFLDRDTRPDFASTVMIPSLQTFLTNPKDIDGLWADRGTEEDIFTS